MNNPTDRQYTRDHEWLQVDSGIATVGITRYAADALGDIVFVQLPKVGDTLTRGEICGEIESTKSVSDLFAPVDGTVLEINDNVVTEPGLVNTDPFGAGWLVRVRATGTPGLLDAAAYQTVIEAEG